jgi:Mg/Co/Ni transporter MgtE
MRPGTCPLCWLQNRPSVMLTVAVGLFLVVLIASLAGLLV